MTERLYFYVGLSVLGLSALVPACSADAPEKSDALPLNLPGQSSASSGQAGAAAAPAPAAGAGGTAQDDSTSEIGGAGTTSAPETAGGGQGGADSVNNVAGAAGAAGAEPTARPELGASEGCGTETQQGTEEFQQFTWMQEVEPGQMQEREFFVRLPASYEAGVPHRVMFLWTGCENPYENAPRTYQAEGANAIAIAPSRIDRCFASSPDSVDVEFFDYMLQFANENYCVDRDRVFSAGHSSGSWMTNVLGCQRADVLRGQANIAGGLPMSIMTTPEVCGAQPIAGIFVHDELDPENDVAGGENARDRLLALNGCSTDTVPVEGREPCVEYQGCREGYPVVWCETQNSTHSRQDELSIPAFWEFFERF